jgi:hypothetical protein
MFLSCRETNQPMPMDDIAANIAAINHKIGVLKDVIPPMFAANFIAAISLLSATLFPKVVGTIYNLILSRRVTLQARQEKAFLLSIANDATLEHNDKVLVLNYAALCYRILLECKDNRIASPALPLLCKQLDSEANKHVLSKLCTKKHKVMAKKIVRLTAQVMSALRQQVHLYMK